jgi:hypothetical protein
LQAHGWWPSIRRTGQHCQSPGSPTLLHFSVSGFIPAVGGCNSLRPLGTFPAPTSSLGDIGPTCPAGRSHPKGFPSFLQAASQPLHQGEYPGGQAKAVLGKCRQEDHTTVESPSLSRTALASIRQVTTSASFLQPTYSRRPRDRARNLQERLGASTLPLIHWGLAGFLRAENPKIQPRLWVTIGSLQSQ